MIRGRFALLWSGIGLAALGLSLGLGLAGPAGAVTTSPAAGTQVAAAAFAVTGTGTGTATAPRAVTGAPSASAPRYVAIDCANRAQVRPASYVITCADAGIGMEGMHWTSWTPQLASAFGTEYENDCMPSCAAGHSHDYPVFAVLWGSARVKGQRAERRYTEVTFVYPGARPPVYSFISGKRVTTYPPAQTFSLNP